MFLVFDKRQGEVICIVEIGRHDTYHDAYIFTLVTFFGVSQRDEGIFWSGYLTSMSSTPVREMKMNHHIG